VKLPLAAFPLILATTAHAAGEPLEFYKDVQPFLKANCISCHNKTTTKAGLNMETPEAMKAGGDSGPALITGKGAESLVVQASRHQNDMEMPPANNKSGAVNLTSGEIELLKLWIDQGAPVAQQEVRQVQWQPLAAGVHPIYAVAVTQDGRYAACGRSNQIFIYDLATRQLVSELHDATAPEKAAHRGMVQTLAFSPDGTRLASGSFREAKLWKLAPSSSTAAAPAAPTTPHPVDPAWLKKTEETTKSKITSSTTAPQGTRIATGSADGVVRLWEKVAAKPTLELRGTYTDLRQTAALEWALGLQTLEQAFQNAEIARIEAQNKALEELLKKANETIAAMQKLVPEKQKVVKPTTDARDMAQKAVDELTTKLAALPADKPDPALVKSLKDAQDKLITTRMTETSALAAVSAAESNLKDAQDEVKRITDTKTRNADGVTAAKAALAASQATAAKVTEEMSTLKKEAAKPSSPPVALAFSADSQQIGAVLEDGSMRLWAVASGAPLDASNKETTHTSLSSGPDGAFVLTRSSTRATPTAPEWKLERTYGGDAEPDRFADRVNAVTFSPDGTKLAAGSGEPSRSGEVVVFETATGKPLQTLKDLHEDAVLSLAFSPDGKLLASGAADKIAKVTDLSTSRQANAFEGHTHHVTGVAFRADGRVLASSGADGVVLTWDMLAGERRKKIEGWTKEVTALQYIGSSNQLVTSAGDNLVRIVSDDGTQVRAMANLPDYMQAVASAPGGGLIIAGGEDSTLRVWDRASGKELAVFKPAGASPP
jgi:WD40 repeat protein